MKGAVVAKCPATGITLLQPRGFQQMICHSLLAHLLFRPPAPPLVVFRHALSRNTTLTTSVASTTWALLLTWSMTYGVAVSAIRQTSWQIARIAALSANTSDAIFAPEING